MESHVLPPMDFASEPARTAKTITDVLSLHGFVAYFAGGCVRDYLMGHRPQDYDIATSATPDEVEKLFKKTIPVGKNFGVMLVVEQERVFEVATFRREGEYADGRHPSNVEFTCAEEDAKRRDFTVNGLFYDPAKQGVLDFVNGQSDIDAQMIRAIGEPRRRFQEDKLRLLRAVRFAANLGFTIERSTWQELCQQVRSIHQVSPERIRDELIKIFTRPGASRGYDLLSQSGLMREILPEIEVMKGVHQPPEFHPEGDVFIHTRLLLEKMESLGSPSLVLAFAALFHDVAKPVTFAVREGRITFYEHAPLGAQMAEAILKRLRFSNEEIKEICACVENHMRFSDVCRMRSGKLKRLIGRSTFPQELELHRIDCMASHGNLENYQFLIKKREEYSEEELKPKPFINGHDLLKLKIPEGPLIKVILEEVYDMQLEGKLRSREEVLGYVAKQVAKGCWKEHLKSKRER